MRPLLRSRSALHSSLELICCQLACLLLAVLVRFADGDLARSGASLSYLSGDPRVEGYHPSFLPTPRNVTFRLGGVAVLRCAVDQLGARTVTWRKASEPHPLTIGTSTFIPDRRVKVLHQTHSLEWNLQISDLQLADGGVYACQVVVSGRRIRQFITLIVDKRPAIIPAKKSIKITGTLFVERGETLHLVCNATGSEYPPDDIDWFKDGNKLKNKDRTTLTNHVNLSQRTIVSSLTISRGNMNDAGTYVCRTSDLQVTSAKVNILNTGTNQGKRESAGATSVTSYNQGQPPSSGHVTRVPPRNKSPVGFPEAGPRLTFVTGAAIFVWIIISHVTCRHCDDIVTNTSK